MNEADLPRGVRNHNPGNLNKFPDQGWNGAAPADQQTDERFLVFADEGGVPADVWGIRALCIVLLSYQLHHGLDTLRTIIGRWAPAGDNNDPLAYALSVAHSMRVGRDDVLNLRDMKTMRGLACGIILVEDAGYVYPPDVVTQAIEAAYAADFIPVIPDVGASVQPATKPSEPPVEPAEIVVTENTSSEIPQITVQDTDAVQEEVEVA